VSHAVADAWRGLVRHRAFGGFVIAILALGAGSATASLLLARKAERHALGAGENLDDLGLTDSEKRDLLGG